MARKNPKRKIKSGGDGFEGVKQTLEKMNYGIVGNHSAVQICRWTKNSLRGEGGCWKEKFYGISSSGCCQMSPSVMWCENSCVHCWRPIEMNLGTEIGRVDDPVKILNEIVEKRKDMLMGFKGRGGIDIEKFEESLEPSVYTMSLSGEPTLYSRIGEMFKEIRRRGAVSFLVTNGLNPKVIQNLKEDELPTQIAISMSAPNEDLFNIWHRSMKRDAWEKFNETLNVLRDLKGKVRRAVRLTLVKEGGGLCEIGNMSEENLKEYVDLIRKVEPDFIHVKGFKSVGYARDRIGYERQPWFEDIREFALKLVGLLDGYGVGGEDKRSCVVMLAKGDVEVMIGRV